MNTCKICGRTGKFGYGTDRHGNKICFECCGELDKDHLRLLKKKEKMILYLTNRGIENWPGTLVIKPTKRKIGKHNIAGTREDVWFDFEGRHFHGVQYGDFSQICHITVVQ